MGAQIAPRERLSAQQGADKWQTALAGARGSGTMRGGRNNLPTREPEGVRGLASKPERLQPAVRFFAAITIS